MCSFPHFAEPLDVRRGGLKGAENMDILFWVLFAVLWLPAGALAYRLSRFFNSFYYDAEWYIYDEYQEKIWRNTAIVFGYFSYLVTVISIISVICIAIFVYGAKLLLFLAGE